MSLQEAKEKFVYSLAKAGIVLNSGTKQEVITFLDEFLKDANAPEPVVEPEQEQGPQPEQDVAHEEQKEGD